MTRISPTNDLAFKKVLGSEENKDILWGLVNDFYGLKPDEIIIQNPYSIKDYKELLEKEDINILRQTLRDVTASLITSDFTTELQIRKTRFFDERSLYYPFELYCRNYNNANQEGINSDGRFNRFSSLKPVYALNILGYNHFKDDDALRIFELYDPVRRKGMNKELVKIGYFELTKTKIETENQRHWRDYFTTGEVADDAPGYIKKASRIIEYVNLRKEEQRMSTLVEKARATYEAEMDHCYHEGREKGIIEVAVKLLLRGISPEIVAEDTGLLLDDVLKLKQN